MKNVVTGAIPLAPMPFVAQAQSLFTADSHSQFHIGAEGGENWLLNSGNDNMDLGHVVEGVAGYDFAPGPTITG